MTHTNPNGQKPSKIFPYVHLFKNSIVLLGILMRSYTSRRFLKLGLHCNCNFQEKDIKQASSLPSYLKKRVESVFGKGR